MSESALLLGPSCAYRFNSLFTVGGSLNALRSIDSRAFRCPRCHARSSFPLARFGRDPALPTYDDRITAGALLATVGAFLLAAVLGVSLAALRAAWWAAPAATGVGLAWMAGYAAVHLARGEIPLARANR